MELGFSSFDQVSYNIPACTTADNQGTLGEMKSGPGRAPIAVRMLYDLSKVIVLVAYRIYCFIRNSVRVRDKHGLKY